LRDKLVLERHAGEGGCHRQGELRREHPASIRCGPPFTWIGTIAPAAGSLRMTSFAIHPPILVRGPRGTFVRSTEEAATYVRRQLLADTRDDANTLLQQLELVGTVDQAKDAGRAFRSWVAQQK
jgi:hypothetical protein